MSLEILIFDVNHGNAIHIRTPNDKDVLIDCGSNDSNEFSPSEYIKKQNRTIDYLIVSHPHCDHISDIEHFVKHHHPNILDRPKMSLSKILDANQKSCEDTVKTYFEYQKLYAEPVDEENDPSNDTFGGGARLINFKSNDNDESNLNNLSVVTFLSYLNFIILFPGDIEEKRWKQLLDDSKFIDLLKKTDILVASHHGRDSGYCDEIFNYFTPDLTIISDGRFGETSATSKYSEKSRGWKVWKSNGEGIKRNVLSTRNDGHIKINVGRNSNNNTYMNVSIN